MISKNKEKFSVREKLSLKILLFMLGIVQPFEYSHEFTKAVKPLEDLINGKEELDE